MANKTFNTRVKNKRDTAANWEAVATTFQPLDGELIIVDTSAGKTRFKVGRYDTAKGRLLYYNEIPFADEYLYNDLNESQGKIYDKLKGIDDKSIIEMTLEPSDGNGKTCVYHIGLWQFPKTGLYKIHLTQHGTTIDLFKVFARKTKDDGTLPEDFTQDNLIIQHIAMGDTQVNDLYIQVDYIDNDKLTVYNVRFLTLIQPYNAQVNVYDKTTQKWQFVSATYVQSAKSADRLAHQLTLTKGDTTTKFDGSTAQTVSIPTKTSELTNDSNFTTQTDLDNLTNTVVSYNAQENITDEQKALARENINAPSPADAVYTATASSTDGVAYTATVSGIDSLTVGASFIMIPNKASTSKAPTLNVNGLGAKPIRRRLSSLTTSLQQGYSTNWIALNKPFTVVYDGTAWVIEGLTKTDGADVYGAVAQATADAKGNNIADTYATIAMLQSMLPKVTTITLTSNWVGDASPYYQDIALSCVTETSIVDLQPTPEQLNSWQDDGIAFTTLSGNGTVRVYVAGGKPSSAISVQVRVQEVTVI